jgi:transposase-like protein
MGAFAVIVASCKHPRVQKNGKHPSGKARFRCPDCGKSWTEETHALDGMRIGLDKAAQIIELLCEGMSVLGTARVAGVSKRTILDLLLYVGPKCDEYMQTNIKGVYVDEVQVDEIWQFVFCKNATAKRWNYVGGSIATPSRQLSAIRSSLSAGKWAGAMKSTRTCSFANWKPQPSATFT